MATGGVWDSFVLLPRILGCWGFFTRAFLPGRLVLVISLVLVPRKYSTSFVDAKILKIVCFDVEVKFKLE